MQICVSRKQVDLVEGRKGQGVCCEKVFETVVNISFHASVFKHWWSCASLLKVSFLLLLSAFFCTHLHFFTSILPCSSSPPCPGAKLPVFHPAAFWYHSMSSTQTSQVSGESVCAMLRVCLIWQFVSVYLQTGTRVVPIFVAMEGVVTPCLLAMWNLYTYIHVSLYGQFEIIISFTWLTKGQFSSP